MGAGPLIRAGFGSRCGAIVSDACDIQKNFRDEIGPTVCFHGVTGNQSEVVFRDEFEFCRFVALH